MTLASFKSSCNAYVEKTPPAYLPEQLSHSTDSLSKLEIVLGHLTKVHLRSVINSVPMVVKKNLISRGSITQAERDDQVLKGAEPGTEHGHPFLPSLDPY